MTNEKARKILFELHEQCCQADSIFCTDTTGTRCEAVDMAIKALEQQPITWIVGKDNCQVAIRNMPIDKMQKICAIIGEMRDASGQFYAAFKAVFYTINAFNCFVRASHLATPFLVNQKSGGCRFIACN